MRFASSTTLPDARALQFSPRGHTFLMRRFDRVRDSRRLYASAMTLTGHADGDAASYLDLEGGVVGLFARARAG